MSKKIKGEICLIFVAFFWGSSYILMKLGLKTFSEPNIIALRFLGAFFMLSPYLVLKRKNIKLKTVLKSAALGAALFGVFILILLGLKSTSASNVAFLQSTYIFLVPFELAFINKKMPKLKVFFSVLLCLFGLWFMNSDGSLKLGRGEILTLFSAVFYSFHILLTQKYVKSEDPVAIGIMQLFFAGAFALFPAVSQGGFHLPKTGEEFLIIILLAIFSSAFGFVGQTVSQRYVPAEICSVIISTEPLFSALFGVIILKEILSGESIFGMLLLFSGAVISTVEFDFFAPLIMKIKNKTARFSS